MRVGESGGSDPSMFACPRCRQRFHRSFLERFWSEWGVVCWAADGQGYRLDCPLHAAPPPEEVVGQPGSSPPPPRSSGGPSETTQVLGACLGDCVLCGAHSRLAVVTGSGVLSRCLHCRDETELDTPPPFCRQPRARSARLVGSRPGPGADRE